jgi:hypothetical protein
MACARVCTGFPRALHWALHRTLQVGLDGNLKGKTLGYGLIRALAAPRARTSCGYDPFGQYARGQWRAN